MGPLDTSPDTPAVTLPEAISRLSRAGIKTARLDAELLMAEAAGVSRAELLSAGPRIDSAAQRWFERMVAQRERREPLAYIVGRREFFSLEFMVDAAVLIPRPETETLVQCALDFLSSRRGATVADIGAGSGAIGVAIAKNAQDVRIVATDISKAALEVAARNARRQGCASRITFTSGDCLDPLGKSLHNVFDLIVSNPPYVRDADFAKLAPEIVNFEPRAALAGGPDGLDFYRRIARGAAYYMRPGGMLMVEVGDSQADEVRSIFRDMGLIPVRAGTRDLAGVERVVSASVGT
jgi:release factor glutamine methyltransferase